MIGPRLVMSATVLRSAATTVDEYGNVVPGPEAGTEYPAWLAPSSARELTNDRQTEILDFVLYLPANAVIEARDRVTVEGVTYEVVEPPARARRPWRGAPLHHVEALVRSINP